MADTSRQRPASIPRLFAAGLAVFAAGGALDLAYHVAPAFWTGTPAVLLLGEGGRTAHIVTLAGMVTTVVGVLTAARRRSAPHGGPRHDGVA